MSTELHFSTNAAWRSTGFEICRDHTDSELFTFEHLNPQVAFREKLTRLERIRLGFYFIRQAFAR